MAEVSDKMIALFVGAILTAALIPVAILQLGGAVLTNVTGATGNETVVNVDPAVIGLYGVISIAVIVAIVIIFFKQV